MIILEKIKIKKWNTTPNKRSTSFELKTKVKTFYCWINEYNDTVRYFCSYWNNNNYSRHFAIEPDQCEFLKFEDAEKYARQHILKLAKNF